MEYEGGLVVAGLVAGQGAGVRAGMVGAGLFLWQGQVGGWVECWCCGRVMYGCGFRFGVVARVFRVVGAGLLLWQGQAGWWVQE